MVTSPDTKFCLVCSKPAPQLDGDTITSVGWRYTRARNDDGTYSLELRCPNCYALYRKKQLAQRQAGGWGGKE